MADTPRPNDGYGAPFIGLTKRWFARFEFKKEDAWIGVFWKRDQHKLSLDVWVCILPMVPLHFGYQPQVTHG